MKKILVIDDDPRMLKLIKNYLDGMYQTYPVKSGNEALAFLDSNEVDLILLDYMMPALDGPHTLELIRQKRGCFNTPVIFLTGVTEKSKVKACMQYNLSGYLMKPVAREELLAMVSEALQNTY